MSWITNILFKFVNIVMWIFENPIINEAIDIMKTLIIDDSVTNEEKQELVVNFLNDNIDIPVLTEGMEYLAFKFVVNILYKLIIKNTPVEEVETNKLAIRYQPIIDDYKVKLGLMKKVALKTIKREVDNG